MSSQKCLIVIALGVLPTESVEDTCIIEPDLEQNEIVEEELVAEGEISTKTEEKEEEAISLDFPVIEDEDVIPPDIKSDEENISQVAEVLSSTSGSVVLSVEIEKDQVWEELPEIVKVTKKDEEKTNKEEENEEESVWKGKEEKYLEDVKEVEEVEEVGGFAAQAVASVGFSLGLSVHGSALVFPAVALPRLKQVNFLFICLQIILKHTQRIFLKLQSRASSSKTIAGDNSRS